MTKKTIKKDDSAQQADQTQPTGIQQVQPQAADDVSLEELQKKIQELEKKEESVGAIHESLEPEPPAEQKKITELTAALARAMADLSNYRRRTEEERLRWMHVSQADLLRMILPVLDNFDRCSQHFPKELDGNDWAKGVLRIHDDLMAILAKIGVKRIETVGKKIDPNIHEALVAVPGEKDVIVAEMEPGYLLKETVLKPARVSVGDGTPGDEKKA